MLWSVLQIDRFLLHLLLVSVVVAQALPDNVPAIVLISVEALLDLLLLDRLIDCFVIELWRRRAATRMLDFIVDVLVPKVRQRHTLFGIRQLEALEPIWTVAAAISVGVQVRRVAGELVLLALIN